MHVVHLETGRHLYGGAQQVLYLLSGLADAGVQSTLVCPPDSAICAAAKHRGISVQAMPMAGDLDAGFARRLKLWLEIQQPDLLHVHSRRGADLWGGLAARQAGVTAILSRRVDNPEFPVIGRVKYRLYERVIAISEEIRAQLHVGGVPNNKVRLVHSAVDAAACRPVWSDAQLRAAFDLQPDDLTVVCAAQLIARKGQTFLLDAWSAVVEGCPHARLLIFGQGPDAAALKEQVSRHRLDEHVLFAGFRPDLLSFLGLADLLVHPALREGLGLCLLEAQAAGVPVIASRAGGIPEAVVDGVSGLLVRPADPAELAAAIVGTLLNPELRARLGAGGRDNVAANFSLPAMVSGNLDVYQELIGVAAA